MSFMTPLRIGTMKWFARYAVPVFRNAAIATMLDIVITWLMKRLILLWDRHNDKLAFSFGRDERTDYSVLVERFYDDYYTVGTAMYPYNNGEES